LCIIDGGTATGDFPVADMACAAAAGPTP